MNIIVCPSFFSENKNLAFGKNLETLRIIGYYNIMARKLAKKKGTFDEEIYKRLGINNLILFGIYSVTSKQKKCTFEKLMKECFTLFPKAFNFLKLSQWPDARKLDRPLRFLRKRKLIKGNPKTVFSLTELGEKTVKDVVRFLTQKKLW